jgi:hypothetical protein
MISIPYSDGKSTEKRVDVIDVSVAAQTPELVLQLALIAVPERP